MITKQDIFLSTQKDMSDEAENIDAVYDIGVVCEIKQIVRIPSSDCLRVIVEGKYRAELLAFSDVNPYLTAVVKRIDSIPYSEKYNLVNPYLSLSHSFSSFFSLSASRCSLSIFSR